MTRRIGIIAALTAELAPLVTGWQRTADGVWQTRAGDADVVAVAKGMGAARAERAVLAAEATRPLTTLVCAGWAGASTCGVIPGSSYVVGTVLDAITGERFSTEEADNPVLLVTTDHVAGRKEKHDFAVNVGASLVDMEAATVARMARDREIPFYCWKAITDIYTEEVPDFAPFLNSERQLETGRLARYAVTHPRVIPTLVRMGRNSRSGAAALRDTLLPWIGQQQ